MELVHDSDATNYIAHNVIAKITEKGERPMTIKEIGAKETNHLAQQMLKVHFGLEIDTFSKGDIINLLNLIQTYLRTNETD